jgi:hypothetical protein
VLDALYRNIAKPGIFTQADMEHFLALFEDAIHQFEAAHEDTYMGRNDAMRRFFNRQKCAHAQQQLALFLIHFHAARAELGRADILCRTPVSDSLA